MHRLWQSTSENRPMHIGNSYFGNSEHFSDELLTRWLTTAESLFKLPFPYKTTSLWGKKGKKTCCPNPWSCNQQLLLHLLLAANLSPIYPCRVEKPGAEARECVKSDAVNLRRDGNEHSPRCPSALCAPALLQAQHHALCEKLVQQCESLGSKFTQNQRLLRLLWLFIGIKINK